MIRFSRSIPRNANEELRTTVERHIRQHISAVADPNDDPNTYADKVDIWQERDGDNTKICGRLNRHPSAPYLRDDFDPDDEARRNPLTVTSIKEDPSVLYTKPYGED